MKIHADKIEAGPPHSITIQGVRKILEAVPPEWIEGMKEVRLANSTKEGRAWAFYNRYDGLLTVYCRCGTPERSLIAIVSELAAKSVSLRMQLGRRHTSAEERHIRPLIQPLMDQLLPMISPPKKKKWSDYNSANLRPVPLSNGNAERPRITKESDAL